MWRIFGWALGWFTREVIVKFFVFTAVFALVAFLVPYVVSYIAPFNSTSGLNNAFGGIPAGVWYFIDVFRVDFGAPLVITAFVYSFLIRRLPVIG